VAGDRRVVGFAGDLVDLVDVDDATLRALDVVIGRLQQLQDDVSWMYRSIEVQTLDCNEMVGEMKASEVTRQLAYALFEQNVRLRGHDSANKAMCAWASAFRYGMLKCSAITCNPFSDLGKLTSAPRRQRWTDQQLDSFIQK